MVQQALLEIHDPSTTSPQEIIARGTFETPMRFFTVFIDDAMAADLLMYNVEPALGKEGTNRKASQVKIKEYALKMLTDEWYLNPQPLIFTERNGKGVIEQGDGQQRLKALRLAAKQNPDISIPFTVCLDAPLLAKMVVDQGKPKRLSDFLRMRGYANAAQLSFAAKMLYCVLELRPFTSIAMWRNTKWTSTTQEAFLKKHPSLIQGLQIAAGTKMLIMPYVGAVLWYLMQQEYGPFAATQFMDGMATGANLKLEDPRLALRNYLSKQKLDAYPWDGFEQLGLLITAVNASTRGSTTYKAGSAYKKTDKKFPELMPKSLLPEAMFTKDGLVSFTADEMDAVGSK